MFAIEMCESYCEFPQKTFIIDVDFSIVINELLSDRAKVKAILLEKDIHILLIMYTKLCQGHLYVGL